MKDYSVDYLEKHGFTVNGLFTYKDEKYYTIREIIYSLGDSGFIQCEIRVLLNTGETWVDVFDGNTRSRIAQYYCEPEEDNQMSIILRRNTNKVMKKYGVYEVKEGDENGVKS